MSLVKAGELAKGRPAASPVPLSAHFGGGPAAVPAVPVAPRGDGQRALFTVLAVVALAVALAGLAWVRKTREPRGER